MVTVALAIIIMVAAILCPRLVPPRETYTSIARNGIRFVGILIALLILASTSFVHIKADETGHVEKIYGIKSLKGGRIIAYEGEKGPQAEIMPPGFHIKPLLTVINNVTKMKVVTIPVGRYGYLNAKDGLSLRAEQTYGDFPTVTDKDTTALVSDAELYLKNGGQKGPQVAVLTPGTYRINRFLWDVTFEGDEHKVTEIEKGFVGVIKSNVRTAVSFGNLIANKPDDCTERKVIVGEKSQGATASDMLAAPVVPVGCIGIWDKALNPGKYYINTHALRVTPIDTRVQTWEYIGGFTKRFISLEVAMDGTIKQSSREKEIATPNTAADPAIFVKVEGWDVPLELRVQVQVTPKNAPFVVASVGGLAEVEHRILTPAIRSIVRNVVGGTIHFQEPVLHSSGEQKGEPVLDTETNKPKMRTVVRPTKVLDLIARRSVLETNIEEIIRRAGKNAGVDIKQVLLGEPAIPPELLVARQREQLAQQLQASYQQERLAQDERVKTEKARATADLQPTLVQAEIEVERAAKLAIARKHEGIGEQDRLTAIAAGQKAQTEVLGAEKVVALRRFELVVNKTFAFLEAHPEVLQAALSNAHKFVPETFFTVSGGSNGNDLISAAAILGKMLNPKGGQATNTIADKQ